MSQNTITGLLVGMHFRPPAKLILECLPSGAKLVLEAEPENAYDEDAVKVLVPAREVPVSQLARLEQELPGFGWSIDDFREQVEQDKSIWLGYLAAAKNKALKDQSELQSNRVFIDAQQLVPWHECSITLGFSSKGEPLVVLTAP